MIILRIIFVALAVGLVFGMGVLGWALKTFGGVGVGLIVLIVIFRGPLGELADRIQGVPK